MREERNNPTTATTSELRSTTAAIPTRSSGWLLGKGSQGTPSTQWAELNVSSTSVAGTMKAKASKTADIAVTR
jgi:hypothetical protein